MLTHISQATRMRRIYEGRIKFKFFCDKCSFKSKRESHFRKHMKLHEGAGAELHSCTECDFKTIRLSHLRRHELLHKNSLLKCNLCGYMTDSNQMLLKHVKLKHPHGRNSSASQQQVSSFFSTSDFSLSFSLALIFLFFSCLLPHLPFHLSVFLPLSLYVFVSLIAGVCMSVDIFVFWFWFFCVCFFLCIPSPKMFHWIVLSHVVEVHVPYSWKHLIVFISITKYIHSYVTCKMITYQKNAWHFLCFSCSDVKYVGIHHPTVTTSHATFWDMAVTPTMQQWLVPMAFSAQCVPKRFSAGSTLTGTSVTSMGPRCAHTCATSAGSPSRGRMHCSSTRWCTCPRPVAPTSSTAPSAARGSAHR